MSLVYPPPRSLTHAIGSKNTKYRKTTRLIKKEKKTCARANSAQHDDNTARRKQWFRIFSCYFSRKCIRFYIKLYKWMKLWHCLMINERSEDQKFIGACKSGACIIFFAFLSISRLNILTLTRPIIQWHGIVELCEPRIMFSHHIWSIFKVRCNF